MGFDQYTRPDFDPEDAAEGGGFQAIDAGWYMGRFRSAEWVQKDADRGYVKLELEGMEGAAKGRIFFDRLNLMNPNETAMEIAEQHLGQILTAHGLPRSAEPADLVGKVIEFKLSKKHDPEYGDEHGFKNEIKGYRKAAGAADVADVPEFDDDDLPF